MEMLNLLYTQQLGFRSGKSTIEAVNKLAYNISDSFDYKKSCLTFFTDLSKTFDCEKHQKLSEKLEWSGNRGIPLG